jgi:hypothetical protein
MKQIKHSLQFITEVDETHPTAKALLALPEQTQIFFLEGMLKDLISPAIKSTLDKANEGGSWAILKVAE